MEPCPDGSKARERALFGKSSGKLTPADKLQYQLFNETEVSSDKASQAPEITSVIREHARTNSG